MLHLHRNLPWCDAGRLLPEILPDQCSVSRHRPDFQHFCRGRDRAPQEAVFGKNRVLELSITELLWRSEVVSRSDDGTESR